MNTQSPSQSPKLIAPSLLSSDFADLKTEINKIEQAGADWLHIDVMDGLFVPNLTIGMPVVKAIKKVSTKILDVHLMIEKPERYLDGFIDAGADYLTLHIESTQVMAESLKHIRSRNVKAGITLRPKTSVQQIEAYLHDVDLVLVMTVEPGFGGQSFMHDQMSKIEWLKNYRDKHNLKFLIEVDGGINPQTAPLCWTSGADVLVAGNAVFQGEKTIQQYQKNIAALK